MAGGGRSRSRPCRVPPGPNKPVQTPPEPIENVSLWRVALRTIVHTSLWFMIPYLVAYYSVMGAWQGLRALLLLLAR